MRFVQKLFKALLPKEKAEAIACGIARVDTRMSFVQASSFRPGDWRHPLKSVRLNQRLSASLPKMRRARASLPL